MTITLITGADKGLGRETARRLIEAGHLVYIGARDPERGSAAARDLGAGFVAINVLDEASVAAAVATVEREHGASVHPARSPYRSLNSAATGERYDRLMIAQVSRRSAGGVGVTGQPGRPAQQGVVFRARRGA